MLSQRGQEEAPFELLIAVIIMAFVIFIGLQAMNFVQIEQCKAQINKSATELINKVQQVSNSGNAVSLVFDPPECFTKPKPSDGEEMRFEIINNPLHCGRLCGSASDKCFVFSYNSAEFSNELCLKDVSPQTVFYTDYPCNETDPDGDGKDEYIAVDMKVGIPRGAYEFVSKTGTIEDFPKICAYRRIGG